MAKKYERLTQEKIEEFAIWGESSTVEFKCNVNMSSDDNKEDLLESIISMSNTEGGYLIIGVCENDEKTGWDVKGTKLSIVAFQDWIANLWHEFVDPKDLFLFTTYSVKIDEESSCIVIHISDEPGRSFGYRMKGRSDHKTKGEKIAYKLLYRADSHDRYEEPATFFEHAYARMQRNIASQPSPQESSLLPFQAMTRDPPEDGYLDRIINELEAVKKINRQAIDTRKKKLKVIRQDVHGLGTQKIAEDNVALEAVIKFLKEEMEEDVPDISLLEDWISLLQMRREDELNERLKNEFSGKTLELFQQSKEGTEERTKLFGIYIRVTKHDDEIIKDYILKAIDEWSDEDFEALSNFLYVSTLQDISKLSNKLYAVREQAEIKNDENKINRIDNFLDKLRI